MTAAADLLAGLKCDVCNDEPAVGVAAVPGVPMSCAYGARCLAANAHPYGIVVTNTALVGGLEYAADWWRQIVDDTLAHLGKSMEQFLEDVKEAISDMDAAMLAEDAKSESTGKPPSADDFL